MKEIRDDLGFINIKNASSWRKTMLGENRDKPWPAETFVRHICDKQCFPKCTKNS